MSFKSVFLKLFVVGLLMGFFSYSSSVSSQSTNQPLVSPFTLSATAYLDMAKNKTGSEQQSLLIMAAGRFIYDGQWREGLSLLSQCSNLPEDLANIKQLLLAKVDLMRGKPKDAITKLASLHTLESMPHYYQAQYHEILATAYQLMGNVAESVAERIKLEKRLPDEQSQANNRRALWLSLTKLPIAELNTMAVEAKDGSDIAGWMSLALISRKQESNTQDILLSIEKWQEQYPTHSGHYMLPSPLASVIPKLFSPPKNIALLLPLTGPLAGPGGAIKDGFTAALQASHQADSIKVNLYNTDKADVATLYQQAIDEGARYIVGPLGKAQVAIVAGLDHPVPTLLLNDIAMPTQDNAYQFGLSPLNEARQVAVKARKKGFTKALIIAPDGEWGDEVLHAFAVQWQSSGAQVVDILHYRPNDVLNTVVRDFLHITDSEARGRQLKQLIGRTIESTPRRRQDFDVIFLLAYPSKARQIMPLLKYYYAGDIPVYGTSAVYSGSVDAMKDRDLDGLIFCDMPWVFDHQMGSRNWPEQLNSYNRLYALGMDSFALSTQLNYLQLFPAMGVSEHSGVLYLTGSNQIARILDWGQFKQGLAQEMH